MTSHNAPRPRGRPSLTQGRAQTVQTSLSPSQAAWVASRGVTAAAYLRGLVEREMDADIAKPKPPARPTPKVGDLISYHGHIGVIRQVAGRIAEVDWSDGDDTSIATVAKCRVITPSLVKIGGDV